MSTARELLGAASSWQDVLRTLYTDAIAAGVRVTSWGKGSPTRAIYYGVARAGAVLSETVRQIANQGFRSTATGDALTLNVKETLGITRPGASYATTTVLVSNAGGGLYVFEPRRLIFLATAKKKTYVNQIAVTIDPLTADIPVDIIAVEEGSDSSALPGEIDAFVTELDGVSVVQSNPALAEDAMSDEDLRAAGDARVGFVPTASTIGAGGAPGAYESVVRAGPDGGGGVLRADGTRIVVTRARVLADGAGGVEVVVADDDGPVTPADLTLLDAAIKAYANPVGTGSAAAVNATPIGQSFTYTIYVPASSGASDEEIEAAAEEALVQYLSRAPIGGFELTTGVSKLPIQAIKTAIANAVTAVAGSTVTVDMATPAADITILGLTDVTVLLGTPAATIERVPGI